MRVVAALLILAALAAVASAETAAEAEKARQRELQETGGNIMLGVYASIAVGYAAYWWVTRRYHPPGESVRAKSRRD